MANGGRGGEVAGVERVGDQLEGHGAVGQRGRLIDELVAGRVLDPELAQIGADAVDCAFVKLAALAVAGLVDRELDGGRTAVEYEDGQGWHEEKPLEVGADSGSQRVNESAKLAALRAS